MKFAKIGITVVAAIALSAGLSACSTDEQAGAHDGPGSMTQVSTVNTKCPMMGGDVDPAYTTDFNGKTVGFCCKGCAGKFNKLSDTAKAELLAASM